MLVRTHNPTVELVDDNRAVGTSLVSVVFHTRIGNLVMITD